MRELEFEIEGVCPLKMDKWVDGKQPKTKEGYLEQAKEKAYRDDGGNLAIPAEAIKAALRFAANELVGIRKGKAVRQTIRACLFLEPDMISLGKKDYDLIDQSIVTRGKGDKVTRVPCYRPLIKNWNGKFKIKYIEGSDLTDDFIEQSLELAGLKYGLLSHRPDFGRFLVKNGGRK